MSYAVRSSVRARVGVVSAQLGVAKFNIGVVRAHCGVVQFDQGAFQASLLVEIVFSGAFHFSGSFRVSCYFMFVQFVI